MGTNLTGLAALEHAVELVTGKPVEELRNTSIDQYRRDLEAERGKPVVVESRFPLIGRGNVMRDRIVTHEEIESALDRILGK